MLVNGDQSLSKEIQNLHARILMGDLTAQAELAEIMLPVLTKKISKIFPSIYDQDLIDMAVTDALLNYFSKPDCYQEQKRSLTGYLLMSARGDLLNYLKPKIVDENSIHLIEDVELLDNDTEENMGGFVAIDDANVEEETFAHLSTVIHQVKELFPVSRDQELIALMLNGVRETEEFAKLLGIEHLSIAEQQDTVKKHKDRIKKTIIRNIDPKGLRNDK